MPLCETLRYLKIFAFKASQHKKSPAEIHPQSLSIIGYINYRTAIGVIETL